MKAPPRRILAPASAQARAAVSVWSADSTAHGPEDQPEGGVGAAEGDARDIDRMGLVAVAVLVGELVGRGDRDDAVDAGIGVELEAGDVVAVGVDDADDRLLGTDDALGPGTGREDPLGDGVDLGGGGVGMEDDEHVAATVPHPRRSRLPNPPLWQDACLPSGP